jgi:hypothetical protein
MNADRRSFRALAIAAALLAASSALPACDSSQTVLKGALPTEPSAVLTAGFVPATLPFQSFGVAACPGRQAFATNFDLVLSERSGFDVFLNQVTFRFSDVAGFSAPPLIFSAADLAGQFGRTLIPAGTSRAFGFRPQFGCGFGRPGQVAATVLLLDGFGRRHISTITATFK